MDDDTSVVRFRDVHVHNQNWTAAVDAKCANEELRISFHVVCVCVFYVVMYFMKTNPLHVITLCSDVQL